ncbi:hypothetical protein BDP27DRAFT_1454841 [Rhodocollybia butyracea]|uniref:Uncharacterized protein n=1 Tax=Rhodocollybia butyracea TaxID=206335 RepID=A0A9P5TVT3_9AGAR|nr:hypothetical protein BDP27DRAFT_1454841 [Rhodocollybia butyracea]
MRLNPIFVILGLICTLHAVPLPDSLVSIAQRTPEATAQPFELDIAITFNAGLPSTSDEAQTAEAQEHTHNAQTGVKSLMNSAFRFALDKHQLKLPGSTKDSMVYGDHTGCGQVYTGKDRAGTLSRDIEGTVEGWGEVKRGKQGDGQIFTRFEIATQTWEPWQ